MDVTGCAILLIDDEEANLDLLELMLRPRGFGRLARVSDPRRAMAAFEETAPDLVLLDLHMPHRSGFELLGDLRARIGDDEFLPVLVLTADATPAAREAALAGGAHDFVLKPFDRTEVLLRVRNLLQTRLLHLAQLRARAQAERTAANERLLADASEALGASFDTATALARVTALLTDRFANGCAVDLVIDGTPVRVASAGDAPGVAGERASTWVAVAQVPVQLPPGHGHEAAGWIVLGRDLARSPFDSADLALASELARRVALAVQNARAYRDAHDAIAARDRVLAVVAHDLRSPLTAARFDVEMLRAEPEVPLAPRDARTLERVERAMTRMDGLIEDLLDLARLNNTPLALERTPQDMGALLVEAAMSLRPLVESRGLHFDVTGASPLPTLDVDARRVLQAMSNLVGNAAKFASNGGRVGLEWTVTDDALQIAVSDDGPGIPVPQLQHIFGAFWQARHADRRGLGLGLSIALGIAEGHGGRLWVESEVGSGSTFFFSLPIERSGAT